MGTMLMTILLVIVLALAMKYLYPQQNPGKKCQRCPAFKQCGGNRPRCPRRSESP